MKSSNETGKFISKFRVGDRVVRVVAYSSTLGRRSTIGAVGIITEFASTCARVRFENGESLYNDLDKIELEHIYNSPLMKALT